jgi:ABC-type Mn2+/Zn2+ transport system permease subunit
MCRRITITIITTMTMLTEPWMQRAILVALFLSPVCALLGVFLTARRMAFFSDTISHAGLAGIAIGLWLGLTEPTWSLIAVGLLVAGAIYWLKEKTELLTDTIMALLLSGSVAIGVILLSALKIRPGEVQGYLFGDILAVSGAEVGQAAGLALFVGVGVFAFLSPLSLITAQEELAEVCGIPVRRANYLFVMVLTLTIALTIRLLGIVLVTALLVIPPAAARNVTKNLRQQIILSILLGAMGGVGGTALSYYLNCACGPTIVLASVGLFFLTMATKYLREFARRPQPSQA